MLATPRRRLESGAFEAYLRHQEPALEGLIHV